jgi:hypothetical protein
MERTVRTSEIESCITLAIKALLDERCGAGYWDGVSSSPYATALALAVMIDLDERFDPAVREKAVRYLIATQRQNGAWALGVVPGEQLPITALCYTALSIYSQRFEEHGDEVLVGAVCKARAYLDRALNFLQTFDINVRSYLSHMIEAHWLAETHNIPLLSSGLQDRMDEVEVQSFEACYSGTQPYNTSVGIVGLARYPDATRLRELQSQQRGDGSWMLDLTPLALMTIARQHGSEEVLRAGCNYLRQAQNADGGFPEFAPADVMVTSYVGFYIADLCWRTGIALPDWLNSLRELLYQWQNSDGSWSWSYSYDGDIDDTAWAVHWLVNGLNEDPDKPELCAARTFIEQAQNDDGGFPDWPGMMSCIDLTAHAYLGLQALGSGGAILQRAAEYLRLRQSKDGSWNAVWNVSKVYGTTQVLMALADRCQSESFFCRGVDFLLQSQGTDGLWDTAEETGMALYVLLFLNPCGYQTAIERGIKALIDSQNGQGYWSAKYIWKGRFSYGTSPWALTPPLVACLAYQAKVLDGKA